MSELRLNKWLAEALGVSRREADDMIAAGRVTVATGVDKAEKSTLGARVDDASRVFLDGKPVAALHGYTYLAFHKPVGYVSSKRAQGQSPTLYELLPENYRGLKSVGRLDKDSSGLILLTNDGDFAHQMTHPSFSKTKLYEIELDRSLEPLHQQEIADFGLTLKDGPSRLGLQKIGEGRRRWSVALTEGRNRQIRRTFGALGYAVLRLHRVQFGKYLLGNLASGEWQELAKP